MDAAFLIPILEQERDFVIVAFAAPAQAGWIEIQLSNIPTPSISA
jgi:hypothetical protein